MNTMPTLLQRTIALCVLASMAACTRQSRHLGGAALPQADATRLDAPAESASPADAHSASDGASVTAPIDVPYESNDGADSRRANPWQEWLDEAAAPVDAPPTVADPGVTVASLTAPADAASAIDAATGGGADVAAAGEGPIRRSTLPTKGTPDACKAMLEVLADPKSGKALDVAMTTVKADGSYVSRAGGTMTRYTKAAAAGQPAGFTLDATTDQVFSDRTYDRPKVVPSGMQCRSPCTMPQSFDAAKPDKLFVQIDGSTGETTLILRSWGDSTVKLTPSCESNMMWGYGGGMFYVITLRPFGVKRE